MVEAIQEPCASLTKKELQSFGGINQLFGKVHLKSHSIHSTTKGLLKNLY